MNLLNLFSSCSTFFLKSASGHVYKYIVFMFVCLFVTATPCSVAAHSNNISN